MDGEYTKIKGEIQRFISEDKRLVLMQGSGTIDRDEEGVFGHTFWMLHLGDEEIALTATDRYWLLNALSASLNIKISNVCWCAFGGGLE